MSCDLDLSKDDFYLFNDLDEINLTVNSENFNFLVTQTNRSFAFGKHTYKVHGKSRGVLLELPYSKPLNGEYSSNFASILAQNIASAAGIAFVWEISDWWVSPNQIYANDESPLEVIRKLVQVPGGVLQSDPDVYDTQLQTSLDNSIIRNYLYGVNTASNDNNKPLWFFTQVGNFGSDSTGIPKREPYLSEVWLNVNLALCFGAKGINYFLYPTISNPNKHNYTGLVQKNTYDPNTLNP